MESGPTRNLQAVWGTSSTDVFAVGEWGIILHFDGTSWSPLRDGAHAELYGVWGTSSTDVFAVGAGALLHYDGSSWAAIPSFSTNSGLSDIWVQSDEIFLVGGLGRAQGIRHIP